MFNKLHRKDFVIAIKNGTDANKTKFQKEAVTGELYYATDTFTLYIAVTTAGASDAIIKSIPAGAPFTGVEWSNMTSGQTVYFDDYQQAVYNYPSSSTLASWNSSNYMSFDLSTLVGKWKKYTLSDYYDSSTLTWTGQMWTDLHSALSTTTIGMSNNSGTLGALNNNQIESSTNTPVYVWAGTGGTTVTAVTANDGAGTSQTFVPIIFGMDWDNMQGWESTLGVSPGPKWGMTIVMGRDDMGTMYLEETYDAYGSMYHGSIYPYASHLFSTTAGNTFTGFSLTGNDGVSDVNSGPNSSTVTGGDQTG